MMDGRTMNGLWIADGFIDDSHALRNIYIFTPRLWAYLHLSQPPRTSEGISQDRFPKGSTEPVHDVSISNGLRNFTLKQQS